MRKIKYILRRLLVCAFCVKCQGAGSARYGRAWTSDITDVARSAVPARCRSRARAGEISRATSSATTLPRPISRTRLRAASTIPSGRHGQAGRSWRRQAPPSTAVGTRPARPVAPGRPPESKPRLMRCLLTIAGNGRCQLIDVSAVQNGTTLALATHSRFRYFGGRMRTYPRPRPGAVRPTGRDYCNAVVGRAWPQRRM